MVNELDDCFLLRFRRIAGFQLRLSQLVNAPEVRMNGWASAHGRTSRDPAAKDEVFKGAPAAP
jgi:hypothetical protein